MVNSQWRAEGDRPSALLEAGLLNSDPEERFDRIVRDAREYFDVSIASVSLIDDDRQITKSIVGAAAQDVPRDVAFCNETVRINTLLAVPDARTDGRFSSNPFVLREPHIRFYAGYPLQGRLGWPIGALDVIDQKPREFSIQDQQSCAASPGGSSRNSVSEPCRMSSIAGSFCADERTGSARAKLVASIGP